VAHARSGAPQLMARALTLLAPRSRLRSPGKMQLHGFARNLDWALTATTGAHAPALLRRSPLLTPNRSPILPLLQAALARPLR
jgi:hypothetical protein